MQMLAALVLTLLSTVLADGADKVSVDVYYESLCPDSMKFIVNQLFPVHMNLSDRINLELIPYGHANYSINAGNYTFNCQHGPVECYGNKVQACGLKHFSGDKVKFVNCLMESSINSMPHKESDYPTKNCTGPADYPTIANCANSTEGDTLLAQMGNMTETGLNKPKFPVPYVVFNKVPNDDFNDKAVTNFMAQLCSQIKSDKPKSCPHGSGASAIIGSIFLFVSTFIMTRLY